MQGPEGMLLAGKYRIVKLIGRGGMANVYLAEDINTGLKVAIKIMRPEFSNDEEFIRRFDTEAKAVASLSHANIVKLFGVGHEGNLRYIVQEYVDGITVKALISQNGHLDWRVAVPIVIQVGMALEYAHKNGIVHRDIKPQNILISRDRIAKITDFGIARASSGNTITMSSGGALGSVHYFSPEQAKGTNVGPQSDIYSVGVMLFEMITGRVPYDGDSNVAIAVKHLQEKIPYASSYVPDIPKGLDAIIQKCMQKVPERRYTSMRQMVTELDALMTDPNGVYGVISTGTPQVANKPEEDVKLSFRQDPNYDKLGELEKSAEARRRSRFRDNIILILIIVTIIGVLVGLSVLIISSLGNATRIEQSSDYTVRNYVGSTLDEIIEELDANHIAHREEYEVREDMDPNIIISQTPAEGSVIRMNSSMTTVVLVVSKSPDAPETFILQDYATLSLVDAQNSIAHLGLVLASPVAEENNAIEPGCVIRTEPAAGSEVSEGQAITIYYVPSSSTVPDLRYMSEAQAQEILSHTRFAYTFVRTPEAESLSPNDRYVIRTDIPANTSVAPTSAFNVYIGTYEDAQRGVTPTPTPPPVHITVEISGNGGTVTGSGDYNIGEIVELVATPQEGYRLDYWMDSMGNQVSVSNTYRFTVQENQTYRFTAVFVAAPTPVPPPPETEPTTVAPDPNGDVNPPVEG